MFLIELAQPFALEPTERRVGFRIHHLLEIVPGQALEREASIPGTRPRKITLQKCHRFAPYFCVLTHSKLVRVADCEI